MPASDAQNVICGFQLNQLGAPWQIAIGPQRALSLRIRWERCIGDRASWCYCRGSQQVCSLIVDCTQASPDRVQWCLKWFVCVCLCMNETKKKGGEGGGHNYQEGPTNGFPTCTISGVNVKYVLSYAHAHAHAYTHTHPHTSTHVSHHWRMQSYAISGSFRVVWQQWVMNTKTAHVRSTLSACHMQNNQLERACCLCVQRDSAGVSEWWERIYLFIFTLFIFTFLV